jgi:hypothetical protein
MKKIFNEKNIILTIIIVLAVLSRLIEHPMNFTPVFALALFSAVYFPNKKAALLIPFSVMFISDIFIGISTLNIAVYFTFGLSYLIGTLYLRNKTSIGRIAVSSVSVSVLFFVISNFYVWAIDPFSMYPKTLDGIIACYQMALPFFRNSVLGDLFYIGLLFGSFSLAEKYLLNSEKIGQNA